jgi:hypothetical protein
VRKPSLTKENDKVLIVAYGESMDKTPWDDESFDLFTLNAAHRLFDPGRASLWFQMHRPGSGHGHIDDPDHVAWLSGWTGCPVFMLEKYEGVPSSAAFPIDNVTSDCGPGRHFYASSIDFMVAYALYQRYSEIHLYGVDMLGPLYQAKKHSLGYYLGVARGRGVAVAMTEECSMLRYTHIYGYEDEPGENKKLVKHLEGFAADCQKEKLRAYAETHEKEGMRKAYQNVIEILKLRDNGSTV